MSTVASSAYQSMDSSLLPSLAWFAVVARHGSFTKAAAEVGVTRAALSQNLKNLEGRLGCRLLHRTTREMSLTGEGRHLLETLAPALESIDQALRSTGDARLEPSGLLRINSSRMGARLLLEPHLPEFLARHPKLRVELVLEDGLSSIVAERCDAGIRLGESLSQHMVAVPITPMLEMAVVGTPDYFARHGQPAIPEDLVKHNCVAYRYANGSNYRWEFSSPDVEGHAFAFEPQGTVVTNDDDSMIRLALQGQCLIQHIDIAVRQHMSDGRLVRVLANWCKPFTGFHLYVPTREQMPAKVRVLMDFLIEKRGPVGRSKARYRAKAPSPPGPAVAGNKPRQS